jgi:putative ABC transport system ATP-binding protein
MIMTKNLSKDYHVGDIEVRALNGVDLEIPPGRFAAIMGHSGSGKSTLLHMLGGIDTPTGGEIRLDGVDLAGMDDDALTGLRRTLIGFVFQAFNLIPTLSVAENVVLPLQIAGVDLKGARSRIEMLLDLTGLSDRSGHRPHQLSGGEQQRVAIARAFVTDPKVVLLDEPTGSLDSATSERILQLLCKSHRELRTTIVMVTHNPLAAAYAEEVVFMKDGKVVDILTRESASGFSAETIYRRMLSL